MENALRATPLDVRQQYEKQLHELREAYGKAMLELRARKKVRPAWSGTRQQKGRGLTQGDIEANWHEMEKGSRPVAS